MRRRILSAALAAAMCLSLLPTPAWAAEPDPGLCAHHPAHTADCGYSAPTEGAPCNHEHTAECYTLGSLPEGNGAYTVTEDTEIVSCVHEHDESCYGDSLPFAESETREPDACAHVHDASCYSDGILPAEGADKAADACTHVHGEDCYSDILPAEDAERTPDACTHECTADSGCVTRVLDCKHAHDETCGYVPADPGHPCGYECRLCPIEELIAALPPHVTEDSRDAVTAQLQEILSLYAALDEAEQEQIDLTLCVRLQEELDGAYAPEPLAGETGDFTVTGDASGYSYDVTNHVLTIKDGANVTISMASGVAMTTTDRIEVEAGANATVTLDGVYIDVRATEKAAAFKIADDSTGNVTVKLEGTNRLISGAGCAGLQKGNRKDASSVGTLTIEGPGSLIATGGGSDRSATIPSAGAGIGGGGSQLASNIIISGGNITALGRTGFCNIVGGVVVGAAGIGGGNATGDNTNIKITGGTVEATGGTDGAGIGGGYRGNCSVTISGGTVKATGGGGGAGIGSGCEASGTGTVTITGGTVTATGGVGGAGIGGGIGTTAPTGCGNGTVTISGGTVIATGGENAAGIGGGMYGSGSLSTTGGSGNAWIVANSISGGSGWTGVIFNGGAGQIYGGDSYTLSQNAEIPGGKTLTVPSGKTLTVGTGATLINNGALTLDGGTLTGSGTLGGGGQFLTTQLTESMITVPDGLFYNGTDQADTIKGQTKAVTTICGKEFQVTGWTGPTVTKRDDLHYTVAYTKDSQTISKPVTLKKSGTDLTAELVDGKETYYSTDTITITAKVTSTGAAPAMLTATFAEPQAGQVAVYKGSDLVCDAQAPDASGARRFEIPAKDLGAGEHTLVVKYIASDVMAAAEQTLTVTVAECPHPNVANGMCTVCNATMVASVRVDGQPITYYTDFAKAWVSANGKTAEIILMASTTVDGGLSANASSPDYKPTNITLNAIDGATLTCNAYAPLFDIGEGGTVTFCSGGYTASSSHCICVTGTGGTAIIKGGTYTGGTNSALSVQDGTVQLSGGTFSVSSGGAGAIQTRSPMTLSDLLAKEASGKKYAYKTTDSTGTGWVSGDTLNGTATPERTTVTVVKAPVQSVTQPTSPEAVVYGYTTAPTLSVTAKAADSSKTISYTWYQVGENDTAVANGSNATLTVPTGLSVGKHKFYCAVTCDGYTVNSDPATVTVNKKTLTPAITGSTTKTYDGKTDGPTGLSIALEGVVNGDTVTAKAASYAYNSANVPEATTITAAGITLSGDAAGNYTLSVTEVTADGTITKSKPTVAFNGYPANATYSGEALAEPTEAQLTITGASYDDVEFAWTKDGSAADPVNAGTYTLTASIAATGNTEAASASQKVTIGPKALAGTVSIDGTAAMNETLSAVLSDSAQTVNYQWYRDNAIINGAIGNSYTLTAADVGKAITVTATGTGNYTRAVTSVPTAAVTQALPTITAWPTASAITYGQALGDSELNGGEAGVAGTFSWTDGNTKPTVADSGTTKYRVTFTPNDTTSYTSVTEDITVTVDPAPLTITAATLEAKTYDGTDVATVTGVSFDGLVNGETLELGTGCTATAAFNSANVNEANTATVTVTLKNGNYSLANPTFQVTDAKIDPKTLAANDLTVTVEPSSYEYTGSAITPTQVTVKHSETVIPAGEYDLAYENNIHVGTATVKITDKEGGNYTLDETTANFQITKLSLAADDVEVILSADEFTYNGTAQTPTVTVKKNGADVAASEYDITYSNTNGGEGDHTNAGTVTVKVTATANGNYEGSKSVEFTISKAVLTPTISGTGEAPFTKTYDGNTTATGLSITLEGVVESDDVTATAGSYTYNSPNVMQATTITAKGITLDGADKDNYTLSSDEVTVAGTITKATVTIEWTVAPQSVEYTGAQAVINAPTVTAENNVTVSVTPEYSYKQGDGAFKTGLPTDAGTYTVRASVEASDNTTAASEDMTLTITAKKVTDPIITLSETAYEYDGTAKEPAVTVKDGETVIPASEYTVTYVNNTAVGTATVAVTDKDGGNYVITEKSVNFDITAASIENAKVTVGGTYTYNGSAQEPTAENVTVTLGGKTLDKDNDYTVSYTDNINAGTATVTVTGTGNYTATVTGSFTIAQTPLTIKANDQTVTYGDSIKTTTGEVMANGLVNSDKLDSVTLTASGDKINPSKAVIMNADGNKIVTGNYQVTYTPGTLTYEKRETKIELNGALGSFAYTGKPVANPAPENLSITGAQYGDVTFAWYRLVPGADDPSTTTADPLSGPPTAAGSYRVVCSIAETEQREGCELEIPVTVTKAGDFGKGYSVPIKEKATGPVTVKLTELSCWPADPGGTPAFEVESRTTIGLAKAEVDANGVLTLTPNGSGSAASGESTPVQDTVTVKVTGMGNYSDSTITINVSYTAKTPITITGVKAADAVYDGNSHAGYTGTPTAAGYNGGFSYVYTDTSGGTSTELPKKAGSYTLEISPVDAADFDGKLTLAFTIEPKPLTWDASSLTAAKPADGTSAAATVQGELKISGVVGTDAVELDGSSAISLTAPAFTGSAPHSEKVALTVSGAKLTGADAGNYTLPVLGPEITATINAVTDQAVEGKDELKLTVESGLSEVPGNLGTTNYNTPAKIETALRTQVTAAMSNANVTVLDVRLQHKDASGNWVDVEPDSFPQGGVTVTLPYPAGTGKTGFTFTVRHMISSGSSAGTIETLTPDLTDAGLKCTFTSLSPVAIGYQKTEKPNPTPTPSGGGNGGGYFPGSGSGILPSNPTYAVTVQTPEHGSVTSGSANASQGTTVTLTVTPDSGYVLDTLTVSNSQGSALMLTNKGGGQYSFTMPSGAVTVTATFAPLPGGVQQPCDGGTDCPSHAFADLGGVGTWYHDAVDYVLSNGLMNGRGDGSFGPNLNLSRAQLAQILYNHAGRPTVGASSFIDVKGSAWYADSVAWAAETGVVTGYAGYFSPDDPITREQLAVMLWRYAGSPAATDRELHFSDADEVSAWALDALRWAVENGIVNGKGGLLDPDGEATRAEAATMLMRYMRDTQE